MASPFFDAIKAGVSGTPGTGAITIGTVTSGFRAFSNVPSNMLVDYRVEDGTAWEIGSGLWNGTTLARGLKYSSTGSLLSLTSAAVVSLIISADEVQPHIGGGKWCLLSAVPGTATASAIGIGTQTGRGTIGSASVTASAAAFRDRQHRFTYASATVANSPAGVSLSSNAVELSSTAFFGGFEFVARWGLSTIPTGVRLWIGMGQNTTLTAEPSATSGHHSTFLKDSTDANIQFYTALSGGSAAKVDTGIALNSSAFYETAIWAGPGERKVNWMICRLDTGVVASGVVSTTGILPGDDQGLWPALLAGTASTTGTAATIDIGSIYLRSSF